MTNQPGDTPGSPENPNDRPTGDQPDEQRGHQPGEQPGQQPGEQPGQQQGQQQGQSPGQPSAGQRPSQPGYWEQQAQQRPQGQGQGQGQPGYPPVYPTGVPVQYAPDHPKATTSLILGILGVVLCQVLAPFAWAMGKKTLNEIDSSQGRIGGRGAAQAGYILGIVGTVILGLSLVFLLIYVVLMVAIIGGGIATSP